MTVFASFDKSSQLMAHLTGHDPSMSAVIEATNTDAIEYFIRAVNNHQKLLKALHRLHSEINNIRDELGTQYPALAEAWGLAGIAIYEAQQC